jgi:integrase-like protein
LRRFWALITGELTFIVGVLLVGTGLWGRDSGPFHVVCGQWAWSARTGTGDRGNTALRRIRGTRPPKSLAGIRWVTVRPILLADVAEHLDEFTGAVPESLVFIGPKGAQLRRSNFTRIWRSALDAAGLVGIHFHDLRHTGNTLAAEAGASLRELMDRMGHSSTRAAYIYQHRTSLRDKMIADEISRRVEAEQTRSGTQRARGNKEPSWPMKGCVGKAAR